MSSSPAGWEVDLTDPRRELCAEYASALAAYLAQGGETYLQRAYALGRRALAAGWGLLDVTSCHHQALAGVLAGGETPSAVIAGSGQFLAESLSPFEITHRGYREADSERKASERRYRELFENANDIVFTVDLNGRVTSVNRAGEDLSGYGRDEVGNLDLKQVVVPRYLPLVRSLLARSMAGELDRTRFEMEIITRDGREVPIEVHTALQYEDGVPVGVHGIARDITERKRAERALRLLNERREEEVKRIAYALHDEAGQLLGSVHLALQEFAQGLPAAARAGLAPVKRLLGEIEEELRRLSHELRPPILDDLGLLPALEFLAAGVAKRSGLTITVRGEGDREMPPAAAIVLYRSVHEALTNVVRHAHATEVHVGVRQEGDEFRCSISDDGTGFDVSAAQQRNGRHGLGLVGIRERVGSLGGTVSIESAPGRGTTLRISVPAGGVPCP